VGESDPTVDESSSRYRGKLRSQPVTDPDQFAQRFHQEILPVLQEYCYDDYSALTHYLGSKLVDAEAQRINDDVLNDPTELIAALIQLVAEDKAT